MPLQLERAQRADAARIAEIHMTAFGSNAMLLAQFPTPAVREALQNWLELKTLAEIDDPKTTVLVVRDIPDQPQAGDVQSRGGPAIAYAKWAHPVAEDEEYTEPSCSWPEGSGLDMLDKWSKTTEAAQQRTLGQKPCYRLTFIGTDPAYERRGAASLMVAWGVEQCRLHNTQAYLESTLEAVGFYKKRGFTEIETFSMDTPGAADGIYRETIFLFTPPTAGS